MGFEFRRLKTKIQFTVCNPQPHSCLQVPRTAAQLDFVLSDAEGRLWDNNGQADFHSAVGGALHGAGLESHLATLLGVHF